MFEGKYELDMVLDIHAHTALTGLFVYGNSYDDVYRCPHIVVCSLLLNVSLQSKSLLCWNFNWVCGDFNWGCRDSVIFLILILDSWIHL